MQLDLSKVNWEGKWFDYNGSRLKIRPRPRSQTKFIMREDGILFSGPERLETFKYCLVEWENVVDQDDSPIPLTDAIKVQLFESGAGGISDFVLEKNLELFSQMASLEKN